VHGQKHRTRREIEQRSGAEAAGAPPDVRMMSCTHTTQATAHPSELHATERSRTAAALTHHRQLRALLAGVVWFVPASSSLHQLAPEHAPPLGVIKMWKRAPEHAPPLGVIKMWKRAT